MVDTSVYKDSWFRLPYQTSEGKEKIHKIKQGKTADFFIHNISENAQPFVTNIPTPEDEPKATQVPKTNAMHLNLSEIERMALKLGSFFDSFDEWVKLGMIIHYETNGSDEGLEILINSLNPLINMTVCKLFLNSFTHVNIQNQTLLKLVACINGFMMLFQKRNKTVF